jgi:hypothetical protein
VRNAPAFGPGQGDRASTKDHPSPTPLDPNRQRIDLRLAFLACASARLALIEEGVMSLDEAFDDAFVENFRAIAGIVCRCEREMLDAFERQHRQLSEQRLRAWRWRRS